MKILLVIHEYLDPNSGAAGSTLALRREYSQMGHEVHLLSYDDLPKSIGIKVNDLIFPYWLFYKLQSLSACEKFDVIDASTGDIWLWSKLFKNRKKRPLLVTRSHGLEHMQHMEYLKSSKRGELELSWKYPIFRGSVLLKQVQQSLIYSDINFQLNSQDADYAIQSLDVSKERTYVFPNGMPESFLNQGFIETPMSPISEVKIAQIGTYHYRKGFQYSIPALNNILNRHQNVIVTFFGTDPPAEPPVAQQEILAKFSDDVRDRVTVVPHFTHSELPQLVKGYHIKLFPTLSEGFGKALVEAMACGLAPISTPAPGPMDVLTDQVDSIIVPFRDSQAIEDQLERLLSDLPLLDKIRRNAYETAQQYSWHSIAKQRLDVYEKEISRLSLFPTSKRNHSISS